MRSGPEIAIILLGIVEWRLLVKTPSKYVDLQAWTSGVFQGVTGGKEIYQAIGMVIE